jgi:hypothetical protein
VVTEVGLEPTPPEGEAAAPPLQAQMAAMLLGLILGRARAPEVLEVPQVRAGPATPRVEVAAVGAGHKETRATSEGLAPRAASRSAGR